MHPNDYNVIKPNSMITRSPNSYGFDAFLISGYIPSRTLRVILYAVYLTKSLTAITLPVTTRYLYIFLHLIISTVDMVFYFLYFIF